MNILKYLLIACSCLIGAAHAQSPIAKDTIEYRAKYGLIKQTWNVMVEKRISRRT